MVICRLTSGDVVFVNKGMYKVIGRGVVESEYIYDAGRDEYKHVRKIKWTHKGEWEHPGQAVQKTLTDITAYIDYVQKLETLFIDDFTGDNNEKEVAYPPYTEDDFLSLNLNLLLIPKDLRQLCLKPITLNSTI